MDRLSNFLFLFGLDVIWSVNKTKLYARLVIRQRANLFEANISDDKISLPKGQSYTEREYSQRLLKFEFKFTYLVNDKLKTIDNMIDE